MKWTVILGLSVACLVYTLCGAGVFHALEYVKSTPTDITSLSVYTTFLTDNPGVTAADLASFTSRVLAAGAGGGVVVGSGAAQEAETDNGWTFDGAFFFCVTVVSTIGYGHISPSTNGGKAFCIVYALLGIPLFATLLAGVAVHMQKPITALHAARPWYPGNPNRDKLLKSTVLFGVTTLLMLLLPAVVFVHTEDWDYLTAVYYNTITLTTVGFGDYVAGKGSTAVYKIFMSVWLVLGLTYLATLVSEVGATYTRLATRSQTPPEGAGGGSEEVSSPSSRPTGDATRSDADAARGKEDEAEGWGEAGSSSDGIRIKISNLG